MIKKFFYTMLLIYITTTGTHAQNTLQDAFPNLTFSAPVFLTHANDGTNRIFVVEQVGIIKVFQNSSTVLTSKEFLNITDRVTSGGEMGLLGLTFHPDYENNGYIYVNYTTDSPNLRTVVSRFQVTNNPDSADADSEYEILTFDQPATNHNGGWVEFRPDDGYLYISTGDGGSDGANSQNITNLLGKILRIDIDSGNPYSIPVTNPFYDSTGNIAREIYAWGFRNPWRCSFDSVTGKFWGGDVGQNSWEEIDIIEIGKNYGWNIMEGLHCFSASDGCDTTGLTLPIWEYGHSPECSITGGYVYRGLNVPELKSKYIYGDFCSRKIWSLEYDGISPPTNQLLVTAPNVITSFGVDQNNELYILTSTGGGDSKIYSFVPTVTTTEQENNLSEYSLEQNFPNPFNPSTIIKFNIPEDSKVTISIYDALGIEVGTIVDEVQHKGAYQKVWNANGLSSGIYFVSMFAQSLNSDATFSKAIKLLYLK